MDTGSSDLPAELRAFLYSCVDSVDQLELLMRLRERGRPATVRELSLECGLAPTLARHHAETLSARGLLHARVGSEVAYEYAPATPELRRYANLLADAYADRRPSVLRFITARAARTFADAFRLRKDE